MPLINIYLVEGQGKEKINNIGDCVHQALMDAWSIPQDDCFQIFHEKKKELFKMNRQMWGVHRSDDLIVLHITTSPRSRAMKLAFYKRLPEILAERINLDPDDVFISIVTNDKEDWSFGAGKAQLL
jgi:phenylpyruvate tautomerase PptA (4-oxalocrotonate tautomerase family)